MSLAILWIFWKSGGISCLNLTQIISKNNFKGVNDSGENKAGLK